MLRRFGGVLVLVLLMTEPGTAAVSSKKGVGAWYFENAARTENALRDANVSWFYTWEPKNYWFATPSNTQFVPMIWGEKHIGTSYFNEARETGTGILLGFNEPDLTGRDHAGITPARALEVWPQLEATGMRLGSPAEAHDPGRSGSWLEQFMNGTSTYTPQVDFICVHWYGTNFNPDQAVNELKAFLDRVYAKFNKPIWLTEYGLAVYWPSYSDPSAQVMAEFATQSVAMLETLTYLERYAWFCLPPWSWDGTPSRLPLYDNKGDPTDVGVAYRAAGGSVSVAAGETVPSLLPGASHRPVRKMPLMLDEHVRHLEVYAQNGTLVARVGSARSLPAIADMRSLRRGVYTVRITGSDHSVTTRTVVHFK